MGRPSTALAPSRSASSKAPARCAGLLDDPLPIIATQVLLRGPKDPGNATVRVRRGQGIVSKSSSTTSTSTGPTSWPPSASPPLLHRWTSSPWAQRTESSTAPAPPTPTAPGSSTAPSTQQFVFFDEGLALELYDRYGDFVVGYLLGTAWSEAVQQALGSPLSGEERILASDCLAGAWVNRASSPTKTTTHRPTSNRATSTRRSRPRSSSATRHRAIDVLGSGFEKIARIPRRCVRRDGQLQRPPGRLTGPTMSGPSDPAPARAERPPERRDQADRRRGHRHQLVPPRGRPAHAQDGRFEVIDPREGDGAPGLPARAT